jgi:hypothetical protein
MLPADRAGQTAPPPAQQAAQTAAAAAANHQAAVGRKTHQSVEHSDSRQQCRKMMLQVGQHMLSAIDGATGAEA